MPIKYSKRKYKRKKITPAQRARMAKARKVLRGLLYNNKIQRKLNSMVNQNMFWGAKSINEIEDGTGSVVLQDNASADELPLLLVSLRTIKNETETTPCIFKLKQNGYDFTGIENVIELGQSGASDLHSWHMNKRKSLLHRYSQVKLLLWQEQARDVHFNVKLVQFRDDALNPYETNLVTTDTEVQDKRKMFFKFLQLRSILSNPLIKNTENLSRDIKKCYRIIWNKDYHLQEQSADFDQSSYKLINIFRKFDQVIDFSGKKQLENETGFNDPESIFQPKQHEDTQATPAEGSKNIFLIISSNCTTSQAENPSGYDTHTLDILLKSKYTAPNTAGRIT